MIVAVSLRKIELLDLHFRRVEFQIQMLHLQKNVISRHIIFSNTSASSAAKYLRRQARGPWRAARRCAYWGTACRRAWRDRSAANPRSQALPRQRMLRPWRSNRVLPALRQPACQPSPPSRLIGDAADATRLLAAVVLVCFSGLFDVSRRGKIRYVYVIVWLLIVITGWCIWMECTMNLGEFVWFAKNAIRLSGQPKVRILYNDHAFL